MWIVFALALLSARIYYERSNYKAADVSFKYHSDYVVFFLNSVTFYKVLYKVKPQSIWVSQREEGERGGDLRRV